MIETIPAYVGRAHLLDRVIENIPDILQVKARRRLESGDSRHLWMQGIAEVDEVERPFAAKSSKELSEIGLDVLAVEFTDDFRAARRMK